ncbi:DinB family protein [Arsukibacterium ikkense]|uniref:DinB family protein n=1 Tax=Arsukibacterium ikkense TaxID=336831 RepID=UPI000699F372|nr:DinB family protein [Arsukibacterium ikkense]
MTVIEHNLQQLQLLSTVLLQLQPEHYRCIKDWPGQPSVGKHVRHVLDHYQQLRLAVASGRLDYRLRLRDEGAETDQAKALFWIGQLKPWLASLNAADLDSQLTYQFAEGQTYTSVERELDFVASHSVHHLALIHAMLEQWDYAWPDSAGVHSSTQEYQQQCAP